MKGPRLPGRAATVVWATVLVVLPWIGMGCVRLLFGVDTGAGFQPAYVLLAIGFVLVGPTTLISTLVSPPGRIWRLITLVGLAAVLLSSGGLFIAPAPVPLEIRLLRYLKQLVQLLLMLAFVLMVVVWLRRPGGWRQSRALLACGLLLQLVYSAFQAIDFHHQLAWFRPLEAAFTSNPAILCGSRELFLGGGFTGIPRLRGTACEPLYLGNYLLLVLPCLLLPGGRRGRYLLLAGAGLTLLLLTWARGAYLGALAAAAVGLVLQRRASPGRLRRRRRTWLLGAGLLLAAAGVLLLVAGPESLLLPLRRLAQSCDLRDWSNLTRLYAMQAAWRGFLASPLLGIGWGQFGYHFPFLVDPRGLQSQFAWPVVHCFPLEILCETGLVGFLLFLVTAAGLAREVWRATSPRWPAGRRHGVVGRRRLALMAAATVGIWVQLLTFSQYNLPHIWVGLGLMLVALQGPDVGGEDG